MNTIKLEKKYILEYIKDILNQIKLNKQLIDNAKFHHNTNYEDAPSIIKNGILTLNDLNKIKEQKYTKEFLIKYSDTTSHVNGIDGVSFAVMGLTDLYKNELEFDSFDPYKVDFLVSSDIKASRNSTNYGNEYISWQSIMTNQIKSVDIRLLELIDKLNLESISDEEILNIISKYNNLYEIAYSIENYNNNLILRENSNNTEYLLDTNKLLKSKKIILKK